MDCQSYTKYRPNETTHNDDIARLADRIIRIEDGKITGGMEL